MPGWVRVVAGLAAGCLVGCGSGASETNGAAGGDGGAGGASGAGAGGAANAPSDPGYPSGRPLLDAVDELCTFLLVGPSDAAGYHATGLNGPGGRGYGRLLHENHPDTPEFAGRDLSSRHPGVRFVDQSKSGFTTTDMLERMNLLIGGLDPGDDGCDTWLHLGIAGNDFNDSISTILDESETRVAAAKARANYAEIVRRVRERFEDASAGRTVVVSMATIQDPTGGTGKIPASFQEGFCSLINNPAFTDDLRAGAIANLRLMNEEMRAEAEVLGAGVVDQHAALLEHDMNAADRWLADDCTHPNDRGHHEIRRRAWYMATGEWW